MKSPFKIAHGVSTYRDTVMLVLKCGDIEGVGEAPVVPYYGSDRDSLVEEIEEFISGLRINSVFKTLIKGKC